MGKKNSTSTSQVTVPPEVLARYNAVNARAETAAAVPFQGYGTQASDFVAPINAQQTAGINSINAAAGSYRPYIDAASNLVGGATASGLAGTAGASNAANAATAGYTPYLSTATNLLGTTAARGMGQTQNAYDQTAGAVSGYSPYLSTATDLLGTTTSRGMGQTQNAYDQTASAVSGYSPYLSTATDRLNAATSQGRSQTQDAYNQTGSAASSYDPYLSAATGGLGLATSRGLQQTQGAYDQTGSAASSYDPYLSAATGATAAGMNAADLSALDINKYLSPYLSQVQGSTAALMNQSNEQAQSGALGRAAASGAFGGDRAGIAAATLNQQNQLAMGKTMADIANQGYGVAANIATGQQAADLAARQANLARLMEGGQQLSTLGLSGANLGLTAAAQQGNLAQQGYNIGSGSAKDLAALGLSGSNLGLTAAAQQGNLAQQGYNIDSSSARDLSALGLSGSNLALTGAAQQGNLAQQGYNMGTGAARDLSALGLSGANLGLTGAAQQGNLAQQGYGMGTGAARDLSAFGLSGANLGLTNAQLQGNLAQQGYGMGTGAAAAMANLGAQNQSLGLQGGQAQVAAGTLQRENEQAGKDALINQFMQEKGYPFQVAQYLANIAMGTGTASGSTTTTVQPASFFSDRRLKEDVKRIGKGDNGLPIYKYRYKGEPETHIGFMADEVEKVNPDAVGMHSTGYKTVDYDRATKAGGGGVAGPYGATTNPQPGLGSYIPEGYLPQYELMIADPSHLENARQSFAQQLEAAANLGNSVKDIEGNWQYWSDKWGSDPKKEAVGQGARSSGVAGEYASGGSAYTRPIGAEMGARTYLSDTLDAQSDQDKKGNGLAPPAQIPQGRTTGQDLADIAKIAMTLFGMNRGGRTGYATRGGVSDEDLRRLREMEEGSATNLLPSGAVPGPSRISRPVTYYPQAPSWKTSPKGDYQYDTNFGMVRDTATGQPISNARYATRNSGQGIDIAQVNARDAAIGGIDEQIKRSRTDAFSAAEDARRRFESRADYAQGSGSLQDPRMQFPQEYDAYQSANDRYNSAKATVMPSSVTRGFGNQPEAMMREVEFKRPLSDTLGLGGGGADRMNTGRERQLDAAFRQRALGNEPPLSMYKEYVSPDDAPFFDPSIPETRPEPTGLGLRLLGNEPPSSMARRSPDDAYIPTPRWALPVEPTSLSYGLAPAGVGGSGTPLSYSPPADRGPAPLSYGLAPAGVGGSGTPLSYSPTGVAPAATLSSANAPTGPAQAATGVVAPTAADTAAPQVTADGLTVVPVSNTTITGLKPGQVAEPMGWNTFGPQAKARESGGDYDALYGFSHRDGGKFAGVKVTDMTINEALAFADPEGEYGQWVAQTRPDKEYGVATPLGAYQIVGRTLRGIKEGMGLTGNEKMTPALQEEMAKWLYQQEGAKPWRASEGKVQTTGGLMPAGGVEEEQFRAANRMEAPGGLKPYDERNVLGKMMYDPETNKLSRNALLSLASGIGATLSSPSQFLLPSLGLGLQSAAGTYAGLEKQAADIGQTKAQTLETQVRTDASRFFTIGPNGMPMVVLGPNQTVTLSEYLQNPQMFSTGNPSLDAKIEEEAKRKAAEGFGGEQPSTGAGGNTPTGVRWGQASQDALARANQAVRTPSGSMNFSVNSQAVNELVNGSTIESTEAVLAKPNSNELAYTVAGAIGAGDMGSVQGYLANSVVAPLNAVLRQIGVEPFLETDDRAIILRKLGSLNAASLTPEQQRAASVYQQFVDVSPDLTMTPQAAAAITSSLMLTNQQAIDKANYYQAFQGAADAGFPPNYMTQGYAGDYSNLHQIEKGNLNDLFLMASDEAKGETVKKFLSAANSGLLTQEKAQEILNYILGAENTSQALARYFITGM